MEPLFIWFFTSPTLSPRGLWGAGAPWSGVAGLLLQGKGTVAGLCSLSQPFATQAKVLPLGENDFLPETLSCSYPLLGNSSEF